MASVAYCTLPPLTNLLSLNKEKRKPKNYCRSKFMMEAEWRKARVIKNTLWDRKIIFKIFRWTILKSIWKSWHISDEE